MIGRCGDGLPAVEGDSTGVMEVIGKAGPDNGIWAGGTGLGVGKVRCVKRNLFTDL